MGEPRLKYDLEANAFVIYRGDTAFVAFEDDAAPEKLVHYSDVRALSDEEGRTFEEGLPFALSPPERRSRRIGLGDLISWLAGAAGIRECAGCRERGRRLNNVPVWGWWVRE
jgi:hypothetical protein